MRIIRLCGVSLLLCLVLAAAPVRSAGAAPYPLGESSLTPAPGSAIQPTSQGLPVSFTVPAPAQLLYATVEISPQNVLGPDGTLADEKRVGYGLLFAHGSGGLTYSGRSMWKSSAPGTYYVQFSGVKIAGLAATCPAGEPACLYASQVYSVRIPEPRRASTRWIPARKRSPQLSARQARGVVRRAIRHETGRKPQGLAYRCSRSTPASFVCKSSWSDRIYEWAMRMTVRVRGKHYVYSARGRRSSRSCLQQASTSRCASKVHWPPRKLARVSP